MNNLYILKTILQISEEKWIAYMKRWEIGPPCGGKEKCDFYFIQYRKY